MNSEEIKKMLLLLLDEAFNKGNNSILKELLSPNFVSHSFNVEPGIEGYKRLIEILKTALPDLNIVIEDIIVENNKIVSRGSLTGTHKGKLINAEPTGKKVQFTYIDIWRIENGKFVENWVTFDALSLLQQLGVVG